MLVLLTVLLTALSISAWLTLQHEKKTILEQINQRGSDISRFVAKSLAYSVVGYDYHTIQLLIDEITLSEDVGYARVVSQKGNIMAESGSLRPGEASLVMFKQDILLDSNKIGLLELGLSTEKTIQYLEEQKYLQLKRDAIIILMIAIGEFIALSYIIIRPVSRMTGTLSNSVDEQGRVIKQLPVLSNDEFGHMASLFNDLGSQLNKANDRLQSKIHFADKELLKTNKRLKKQSRELELINKEFKKLSITDALTGIYNRRYFEELMRNDIEMTRRYGDTNSMLLIDIDHFKSINDTHGHPCGDKVLINLSNILRSRIRASDNLCRIGGEEFAVLCKHADKETAIEIASKLREIIASESINCAGKLIAVTISIGIVTITNDDKDMDQHRMYSQADLAVYHSKKTGRNRVVHYADLQSTDRS